MKWLLSQFIAAAMAILLPTSSSASSLKSINMCVFDMLGQNGPTHQILKRYKMEAIKWGAAIEFKSYTDERLAAEAFNSGVCDLVNLPDIRARNYNHFTGSLNAIGAIPTYQHIKIILQTLSTPKAAKYMRQDEYEIVSISPTGGLFTFVRDRNWDTPEKLAGKKITLLDNAPESQYLIKQTGMTPVSSTIANALQKFNNHSVDITGAPAIAYEPMELYKGLEPNGGIISWPLLQTTAQIVARWQNLPEGFGQKSREFTQSGIKDGIENIEKIEQAIPSKYWIGIPNERKDQWSETFRQNRIALKDQGVYHSKALTLFRKVRCKITPEMAECTAPDRE
ncbi:putative solute-binding protein [Alkalimarinus coralli]|uniref:putative solute-binding protein n=1 Tax=Alkalimarinus coralli TaxID=2935863 RepID=UPI00202AC6D9|nr:putative solute-binding protein [Alkalimarinus coralli]